MREIQRVRWNKVCTSIEGSLVKIQVKKHTQIFYAQDQNAQNEMVIYHSCLNTLTLYEYMLEILKIWNNVDP